MMLTMSIPGLQASLFVVVASACTVQTAPGAAPWSPPPSGPPVSHAPSAAPAAVAATCADPGDRDFPDVEDQPTNLAPTSTTVGCLDKTDSDLFLITVPADKGSAAVQIVVNGYGKVIPHIEILDGHRKHLLS